jgi:hypothetical protein
MASTTNLSGLRFCPDCGQPTSKGWSGGGTTLCRSKRIKITCNPSANTNYCGQCGKAYHGEKCEGWSNRPRKWYEYEPSETEKTFWHYFSPLEVPLILVWCFPVAIFLRWLIEDLLGWNMPAFKDTAIFHILLGHFLVSATSYGLMRSLARMLRQNVLTTLEARTVTTEQPQATDLRIPIMAIPVARVINPDGAVPALYPCPDCGHSVSRRAERCPGCGCPNDHKA